MKQAFLFCLLALAYNICHSQNFEIITDRTGKKILRGFVSDSALLVDTASFSWFAENEKVYVPPKNIVKSFAEKKDSISFLIFFGTWCPDSHYVVPRFFKIINEAGIDRNHITLFALDRSKMDGAHFASNFKVSHVPTIIVLKDGKERGRLIEYGPSGRFDEALATILDQL